MDGTFVGWIPNQGTMSTSSRPESACPYCSSEWSWTVHTGKCPKVAELEYHKNGTLKRVRFHPEGPA